jgi:hypothetical protein
VGAAYDRGPLLVRGEYYDGERKTAAAENVKGYYVMAAYTVTENLDVSARYQQFEDEQWGLTNNRVVATDFGVKYFFERKGRGGTNVALNYMVRDADSGVTQKIFDERGANLSGDNIDNVLMTRLQVQF